MTGLIEYRVRPVTRFIVTRYERDEPNERGLCGAGASSTHGEFDNHDTAYAVGYALAKADHERMGWPIDDERIKYPEREPEPAPARD
jgi:hypothetical protein